ncbi:MAG: hypothetical protein AAGF23_05380 [Acidobacteriota bacterium]
MKHRRPRPRHTFLLVPVALLLSVGCGAPTEPGEESAPESAAAPAPAGSTSPPPAANSERRGPGQGVLTRRPFWHDGDLVEQLGLDDAQLSIMETRRQGAIDAARTERQATTARRGELSAALGEGRWQEARDLAEILGADATSSIEADVELKIGILDMLSAEQRRTLLRERPAALRRSWLLPTGGRPPSGPNPLLDRPQPAAGAPSSGPSAG